MPAPKTSTERQTAYLLRRRESGLVPLMVWVRPEHVPEVRALVAKLSRRKSVT